MSNPWRGTRTGRYRALTNVWFYAVSSAANERELLEAVGDFVSSWTPTELSRLPESCRPGRLDSLGAIAELTFQLGECRLKLGPSDDRVTFERMYAFFLHANGRAARLLCAERAPRRNHR